MPSRYNPPPQPPDTAALFSHQSLNTIALRTGVLALATIGRIAVLGVVSVSLYPQ